MHYQKQTDLGGEYIIRTGERDIAIYADQSAYVNRSTPCNGMQFETPEKLDAWLSDAEQVEAPEQVELPAPDPKETHRAYLQQTDTDGSLSRIIEDLADQIVALGGTIPAPAKAKLDARKTARQALVQ